MNGYDFEIQGYQGKPPYFSRQRYNGKKYLVQVQNTKRNVLLFNKIYHEMV